MIHAGQISPFYPKHILPVLHQELSQLGEVWYGASMKNTHEQATEILGPYAMPQDLARLYYGRLLWRKERTRARLLRHWTDERHPYRDRFLETWRPVVEEVLLADPAHDLELDASLKARGLSLRVVVREIPPVIGSFFAASRMSPEITPVSLSSL